MLRRILLFFMFIVPMIEIFVFILVGKWIGAFPTLLLAGLTSLLGLYLLRREGTHTYQLVRLQLQNRQIPGKALLDGVFVMIGGYLLIIPGFITDAIGLLCILPYTRNILLFWLLIWLERRFASGNYIFRRW